MCRPYPCDSGADLSVCTDEKVTIYNKIKEKFKFTVPIIMHWKNIIVDSVDSALDRTDTCRFIATVCCQPDTTNEALTPATGSSSSCTVEHTPTEICHYTTGEYIFKIGDHQEQIIANPGKLILEVSRGKLTIL